MPSDALSAALGSGGAVTLILFGAGWLVKRRAEARTAEAIRFRQAQESLLASSYRLKELLDGGLFSGSSPAFQSPWESEALNRWLPFGLAESVRLIPDLSNASGETILAKLRSEITDELRKRNESLGLTVSEFSGAILRLGGVNLRDEFVRLRKETSLLADWADRTLTRAVSSTRKTEEAAVESTLEPDDSYFVSFRRRALDVRILAQSVITSIRSL
jgi:hypothetical protein